MFLFSIFYLLFWLTKVKIFYTILLESEEIKMTYVKINGTWYKELQFFKDNEDLLAKKWENYAKFKKELYGL